jgi:hypothetical protein
MQLSAPACSLCCGATAREDHVPPGSWSFLSEPHRYKVLYGGRGGDKSSSVAQHVLIAGANQRGDLCEPCKVSTRRPCCRWLHGSMDIQGPARVADKRLPVIVRESQRESNYRPISRKSETVNFICLSSGFPFDVGPSTPCALDGVARQFPFPKTERV